MTKADIIERVHEQIYSHGFSKKQCADFVESIFEIIKLKLEQGEKVKLAGFCNFEVKSKKDRLGRNPQTGESMTISARKILTFKPSIILKRAVNE